ncbi:MAG: hypothetical protein EP319_13880 [Deltaproteobacteria bacterium]|nr:MAG: hypothetical protein EP319_13880 [Deltaproteobacteria bacterium]
MVNKLGIFSQMFFPSFDFNLLLQKRNPFSDYIRHQSRDVIAHTNGWSEYIGNKSDEARLVRHYENEFKMQPPRHDISSELQKFAKEMNQSRKRIFFFESPMSPEVLAAERKGFPQRDMYLARLYSSLKSLGACHISISGRFKTYDGDHMISSEAKRFSKLLGEKIRNQDCEK